MKGLKKAALCGLSLFMSGCTALNFTVDGLLNAPKLTLEQSDIHQALIESVGSNITIKYPKNGQNRSAYVIGNIDSEPGDEALAFYKYSSGSEDDNGVRINVLDKDNNGKWYSVKELAGAGTDIDRVILTNIGGNNQTDVLVGYQSMSEDSRTLEIYNYDGKSFKRIGASNYSLLDTLDINSDGKNEIITVQREVGGDKAESAAKVSLLKLADGKITKDEEIDMCSNAVTYASSVTGQLKDGRNGIYIDSINTEGKLQTELVYYRYSKLQNPMQSGAEKLLKASERPNGYFSTDIDSDGVVEIPCVTPMTGYENAVDDEVVYLTSWNEYADFYKFEEKYKGYYCISDGYFFAFPKRWSDKVTVKRDTASGEFVYFKYSGDINSKMEELMRIAVSPKNKSQNYLDDGYEMIDSKGQLDYFVKLPADKREQLILTIDEVQNNFYIMD